MARYDDEDYNEISTGEWIVSLILSYIPLIGLIMLLVWAFGGGTSPTKANWAKAQLIIVVATFGLAIALYLTILASLAQYGSMPHQAHDKRFAETVQTISFSANHPFPPQAKERLAKTFKSSLHLGKSKCRLLYSFQFNIQLAPFAIHYTCCI